MLNVTKIMCSKELPQKDFWMVRAGAENELVDSFYEDSLAAIGWKKIDDFSGYDTSEELERDVKRVYDDKNQRQICSCSGQLFRFAYEIEEGDIVLTYDQPDRTYFVDEFTGPYLWNPSTAPETYPHVRQVHWKEIIHRDESDWLAKNTLRSSLTVFSLERIGDNINDITFESEDGGSKSPGMPDSDPTLTLD